MSLVVSLTRRGENNATAQCWELSRETNLQIKISSRENQIWGSCISLLLEMSPQPPQIVFEVHSLRLCRVSGLSESPIAIPTSLAHSRLELCLISAGHRMAEFQPVVFAWVVYRKEGPPDMR